MAGAMPDPRAGAPPPRPGPTGGEGLSGRPTQPDAARAAGASWPPPPAHAPPTPPASGFGSGAARIDDVGTDLGLSAGHGGTALPESEGGVRRDDDVRAPLDRSVGGGDTMSGEPTVRAMAPPASGAAPSAASPWPASAAASPPGAAGPARAIDDRAVASMSAGYVIQGRYRVLRLLGAGGMGAVYAVHDSLRRKDVALKVMLPSLIARPKAAQRFEDEAEVMLQLSHPGIVRVFDVGHDPALGLRYFTMELLEGMTLREWLDAKQRAGELVEPGDALEVCRQILEALRFAHAITVHRDLKPENVFLVAATPEESARGVPFRVRILDFGIAKLADRENLTGTSVALGTAYYMAPEQQRDAKSVDQRADLYSVSVMLYEMLTGKLPVGRFKSPAEERRALPAGIDALVLQGLATDPLARPDTAERLLAEIAALRAAIERGPRRSPARWVAAIAAALAVGAALYVGLPGVLRDRAASTRDAEGRAEGLPERAGPAAPPAAAGGTATSAAAGAPRAPAAAPPSATEPATAGPATPVGPASPTPTESLAAAPTSSAAAASTPAGADPSRPAAGPAGASTPAIALSIRTSPARAHVTVAGGGLAAPLDLGRAPTALALPEGAPPGRYTITATASDGPYEPRSIEVELAPGANPEVEVELAFAPPAGGALTERQLRLEADLRSAEARAAGSGGLATDAAAALLERHRATPAERAWVRAQVDAALAWRAEDERWRRVERPALENEVAAHDAERAAAAATLEGLRAARAGGRLDLADPAARQARVDALLAGERACFDEARKLFDQAFAEEESAQRREAEAIEAGGRIAAHKAAIVRLRRQLHTSDRTEAARARNQLVKEERALANAEEEQARARRAAAEHRARAAELDRAGKAKQAEAQALRRHADDDPARPLDEAERAAVVADLDRRIEDATRAEAAAAARLAAAARRLADAEAAARAAAEAVPAESRALIEAYLGELRGD